MTDTRGFFGDLSPFELFTSAVALSTATWIFIVDRIRGAKICVKPGDALGLVLSSGYPSYKFHLVLGFSNHGPKPGTVQHVDLRVRTPRRVVHDFSWKQFYRYADDRFSVEPDLPAYPFAISPGATDARFVEFELLGKDAVNWEPGKYELELRVWVDKDSADQEESFSYSFSITLTDRMAVVAGKGLPPSNPQAQIETLRIDGWNRETWQQHELRRRGADRDSV